MKQDMDKNKDPLGFNPSPKLSNGCKNAWSSLWSKIITMNGFITKNDYIKKMELLKANFRKHWQNPYCWHLISLSYQQDSKEFMIHKFRILVCYFGIHNIHWKMTLLMVQSYLSLELDVFINIINALVNVSRQRFATVCLFVSSIFFH